MSLNLNKMWLPALVSDGMVLQRGNKTSITGKASKNEDILIEFCDEKYESITDENGYFKVTLKNLEAGGPYEMIIKGKEERRIKDILIGDVYVCSGQSNMELPISRVFDLYEDEVNGYSNSNIRRFTLLKEYDFHGPQEEINGSGWLEINPQNACECSAVAYFFAKDLYEKYKIPIGLIINAVGGSRAESWTSEEALNKYSRFTETIERCKNDYYVQATIKSDMDRINEWYTTINNIDEGYKDEQDRWYSENYDDSNWRTMTVPQSFEGTELENINGCIWFRKEIYLSKCAENFKSKLLLGAIVDWDAVYINGIKVGQTDYMYPPRKYDIPKDILKEGKNIITIRLISNINVGGFIKDKDYELIIGSEKIDLKGLWKYKIGCNMEALEQQTFFEFKPVGLYNKLIYPIKDYNIAVVIWYQGESNTEYPYDYEELFTDMIKNWRETWNIGDFPFLFVQLANYMEPSEEYSESNWALVRDLQRRTLKVNNTGMAVAIDLGEYNDLHPLNKKDVGKRLALCARKIIYNEEIVHSGPLYEKLEVCNNKAKVYFTNIASGLLVKGSELKHFAVCGEDDIYIPAKAILTNNVVEVVSDKVDCICGVRYCWADCPLEVTLYNKEGLPASPFSTK